MEIIDIELRLAQRLLSEKMNQEKLLIKMKLVNRHFEVDPWMLSQ